MEFLLQPGVYRTGDASTLLKLLDNMWIKDHSVGAGTLYIISGFANYNGGVRFYPYFTRHVQSGGKIVAYIGGSTAQRLSSIQVVEALLECGAEVNVVNRKRLLHAKCYGYKTPDDEELVVTSGNFTGPGMSQNAEAAIRVEKEHIQEMNFSWTEFVKSISEQKWDIHQLSVADVVEKKDPAWTLLYDEVHGTTKIDESQEVTMVITLSHSDTARIQAEPGSKAGLGTQYFWLSKGTFDFFPALTIKNTRGTKNTFSCIINMNYIDLNLVQEARVTFEADNNLDFRLGTGAFRYTKKAKENDLALITRLSEYDDVLPMIGLNNEDRYPAKTFSIIHELVHLIKRSSAVCNEMMSSFSAQKEEVFCNAVAGEVLVPKANLLKQLGSYTADEIDLDMVETIAAKFSVSKEVVCRRLLDTKKISQAHYSSLMATIRTAFENEREQMREYRRITGKTIPRNISREAIDQNSSSLCKTFYHGFREGYFDKQDVARYLGVKQNHIDKFMWEVSKW